MKMKPSIEPSRAGTGSARSDTGTWLPSPSASAISPRHARCSARTWPIMRCARLRSLNSATS